MYRFPPIYLASKSPRRRELLERIGVVHEVIRLREHPERGADVNEDPLPDEAPDVYVQRVADLKAEAAFRRIRMRGLEPRPVLAADTTVCLGHRIFGKPADDADAVRMLSALSGHEHEVLTAVVLRTAAGRSAVLSRNTVRFRALDAGEIRAYVATGEPRDKAGGYAIQGLAQAFIPSIVGSYSGVMGLPLSETVGLLRELAHD